MLATAVTAARLRHQSVIEDVEGGTVQIGTAQYKAAIHISGIKLEHKADGSGFQRVQRITASIRKSLLRTAPPRDTILQILSPATLSGVKFSVAEVSGQSVRDVAHVIHAARIV